MLQRSVDNSIPRGAHDVLDAPPATRHRVAPRSARATSVSTDDRASRARLGSKETENSLSARISKVLLVSIVGTAASRRKKAMASQRNNFTRVSEQTKEESRPHFVEKSTNEQQEEESQNYQINSAGLMCMLLIEIRFVSSQLIFGQIVLPSLRI